jgi:undecaprenyl-diphosphatase
MDGEGDLLLALVVGLIQGTFEWLPISSEGQITLLLAVVGNVPEGSAAEFSLLLHAGTGLSATAYYRGELWAIAAALRERLGGGPLEQAGELRFLVVATLVSAVVGAVAFLVLDQLASALSGGAFVALIGVLLVATGLLQRLAGDGQVGRDQPDLLDALLVGTMQGVAILPGVSRSGTTTGAMLLRGHDGPSSFRLSFLLSIPAAFGAGALVLLTEGLPGITPAAAAVALTVSALVGYLTIDALLRVVERVAFWGICVGLGALAVAGGVVIVLA